MTVGQFREDGVTVTAGLAPGDVVVTAGVHKLRPTSRCASPQARRPRRPHAPTLGAAVLRRFNLSEWALAHQTLVLYFMVVLALVGVGSYLRLGQAEDPDFTFKLMVVRTLWPGASAEEVERQLTDKIEKKLQETPRLDFLRSYSQAGRVGGVRVREGLRAPRRDQGHLVPGAQEGGRHPRAPCPRASSGPFFNDEFGDTFGNIYALTGDGYTYAQLKETADRIRNQLLRVKDVAKVELVGEQDEKIYVELANAKLATFGVEPAVVFAALAAAERGRRHRQLRDAHRPHLHPRERTRRSGGGWSVPEAASHG